MIVILGQNEAAEAITARVALQKFIQDARALGLPEHTQAYYERDRIAPALKLIAAIDGALEAWGVRLEPVT